MQTVNTEGGVSICRGIALLVLHTVREFLQYYKMKIK